MVNVHHNLFAKMLLSALLVLLILEFVLSALLIIIWCKLSVSAIQNVYLIRQPTAKHALEISKHVPCAKLVWFMILNKEFAVIIMVVQALPLLAKQMIFAQPVIIRLAHVQPVQRTIY